MQMEPAFLLEMMLEQISITTDPFPVRKGKHVLL